MKQYQFDPEKLWTLLTPAIQLLKETENADDDHGESCLHKTSRSAQAIVLNSLYSRACGEWASAGARYAERKPVTEVDLYRHAGLAVLVQLKLLGVSWMTLRSALWQQTQPKTDLYLDRFLMVARYLLDNPVLLVEVAKQYPGVWTNLVNHLEPVVVDDQWKLYAALRDIGDAERKLRCSQYVKPSTYSTYVKTKNDFTVTTPPSRIPTPVTMSGMPPIEEHTSVCPICDHEADRSLTVPCMSPTEEAAYIAEHLWRKPDYSQPDCFVQFIPEAYVLPACPKCQDDSYYLVVVRKSAIVPWSLEVGCGCGWSRKVFFTKMVEDAFTSTNGAGYLAYWMQSARGAFQSVNQHGGPRKSNIPEVQYSKTKGLVFDGSEKTISPGLVVPRFTANKYWSCVIPFDISEKASEAILDGTHPLVPAPKQHFIGPVQYEQKGHVTVYSYELTAAQEWQLAEQYGPFVKTPYTGSIKVGDTSTMTIKAKTGKTTMSVQSGPLPEGTWAGKGGKALGRELMALDVPMTLAEQVKEIVDQSGVVPTMEVGSGQPGIQWAWARGCGRALTAAEHAELYQAQLISNEAADAVWKRITGEE